MIETEYQRAWRERGEAEAALRKWHNNQSNPAFTKGFGVLGLLAGGGIMAAFIGDPAWSYSPILLLAAMFMATGFLAPSILRDEAKARAEARETLQRLWPEWANKQ